MNNMKKNAWSYGEFYDIKLPNRNPMEDFFISVGLIPILITPIVYLSGIRLLLSVTPGGR